MKRSRRPDRRLRAQVAREESCCWLCGDPIDYGLHHSDPWSYQMDHKVALKNGGVTVRENVAASHKVCNLRKGDRRVESEVFPRSRDW